MPEETVADDGLWLSARPQRHPPDGLVSVELSFTLGRLPMAAVRRNGSLLRADGDGRWSRLAVVRLPARPQVDAAVFPDATDTAADDPETLALTTPLDGAWASLGVLPDGRYRLRFDPVRADLVLPVPLTQLWPYPSVLDEQEWEAARAARGRVVPRFTPGQLDAAARALMADTDPAWLRALHCRLTHVSPRSGPMPFPDGQRVTVGVDRLTPSVRRAFRERFGDVVHVVLDSHYGVRD